MSPDNNKLGSGATDEGWDEEITRTNHNSNNKTEKPPQNQTEEQPNPQTKNQTTVRTANSIQWNKFLGDEEIAIHAEKIRQEFNGIDFTGRTDNVDLTPPTRRFLNSKSNSTDGVKQLNLRIEPKTLQGYRELERAVSDNFDDTIRSAYLADAIVRIACLHSEEVFAMLGAYGFDFEFK